MVRICNLIVLFLHESTIVPVLMYGSETMMWKEKERSRIRAIQMDNLRGLLGIKRMDKIPNSLLRELCRMMNLVDLRVNDSSAVCREWREKGLLRWYMYGSVLVIAQCVGCGRGGLIPRMNA